MPGSRLRGVLALSATAALAASTLAFAPLQALETERHVIVLHDGITDVTATADGILTPLGLEAEHLYDTALQGFSVDLPSTLVPVVAANPLVDLVEADRVFTTTAELPAGVDRTDADRISGSKIGTRQGVDVDVAVLDTGSDPDHRDLNVVREIDCYSNGGLFSASECIDRTGTNSSGADDDHGHGTHVAGTVGAVDNGLDVVGVAPGARIWSVKVLGGALGSGSTSDIIDGIDFIAAAGEVEVINMSLGGSGTSQATNRAIQGAADAGVVTVVAAGNDGANAANYTPANAPAAITVSAITDLDGQPGGNAGGSCSGGDDTLATYSNFGDVVDIAAPGSCIISTQNNGGTTSKSGTSMASPHVAGAVALYIERNDVPADANRRDTVLAGLLGEWATPQTGACGFANGVSGEPLLLLVPCGQEPGPDPDPDPEPDNTAPTVDVTAPTDGTTVTEGEAITFTADATDAEDGTTAVSWSSDRDGALGDGASITATLSVGTHAVTASTTDSAGASASDSVTVTVEAAPAPTESVSISDIRWDDGSVLLGGRWVDAWVEVSDADGTTVSGADVRVRFSRNGSANNTQTERTASNGEAYYQNNGVSRGCWTLEVLSVTTDAGDFDGVTPANEYCF